MRRIALLIVPALLLAGCAQMSGTNLNLWALIEKRGQAEPKLTAYEQGKRYLQLGSIGLAIGAFQKELGDHPNSVPALNGLAVAYQRIGRSDVAQRYLDLALTLDPKSAVTLNNLAYLNLTQGNTAVALDYGSRAKEAAEAATEMQLPAVIASAVSKNIEIANELAMSEIREMAAKETLSALEMSLDIEQIGANEWQLRIPAIKPSDVADVPTVLPPAKAPAVKASDWKASLSGDSRVRVVNGTGRRLMASRFAGYLSGHGLKVRQLANADRYSYKASTIFYNPDQYDFALSLSRLLPFPIKLLEAKKGIGQIDIVLGSDLLIFDDGLRAA